MQELDSKARSVLDGLLGNNQSGATELALLTLGDLLRYQEEVRPGADRLGQLISELRAARPSMVVIGNALAMVSEGIAGRPSDPAGAIADTRRQLENASATIARLARLQLPRNPVIMTHSASSMVRALFQELVAADQPFSVICSQSSPGFEGHTLARTLNDLAVPVTLITDAQMGLFVSQADVVITGCDTWLTDGHFINKAGTGPLALAARASGIPFWVLADSFRNSEASHRSVHLEEMPAAELNAPQGDWITPRNVYFEVIPQSLIDKRISEQGVFSYPAEPGQ